MPQQNYIKAKMIDDRIDRLLPLKNVYFFKIFPGNDKKNKKRNKIE